MSVLYQRNRIYSLIVGTQDNAIEITNLQIRFEVTKTNNNREKKNQAKVSIYNLTRENQKALEEDYVTVQLRAGYSDLIAEGDEIPLLFSGQVVDLKTQTDGNYLTERHNTDIITTLTVDTLFSQLNGRVVSRTIPAGKSVKDAILGVVQGIPEISRKEIKGKNAEKEMVDGMPLSGSPRQCLDQICKASGLQWQIDNDILYVSDVDGTYTDNLNTVPKIGQFSGLIERPMFKSEDTKRIRMKDKYRADGDKPNSKSESKETLKIPTMHCKILMNPTIVAGSTIYLDYEDISGYYIVSEVSHRGDYFGNEWYSELILSSQK